MAATKEHVQRVLDTIPSLYRGPGGAVAVIKDGELVGQRAWGYADLDARVAMTPTTLMPICSITKQMLCYTLASLERDPPRGLAAKGSIHQQVSDALPSLLRPEILQGTGLTLDHLCDNQSGIRDYWALATPLGARADGAFSMAADAPAVLDRIRSLHFAPGAEYSYSNVNFHIVARALERVTGAPLGDLLAERLFTPAGMATAALRPDTAALPPPCVGYEGDAQRGWFAARNAIEWAGDAGVVASLADMAAYERHFDAVWRNPEDPYRETVQPRDFSDGAPSRYRYGLGHGKVGGVDNVVGHGGALRGFRLHRAYAPQQRVSVVVLFNHEADAGEAAEHVLKAVLGLPSSDEAKAEAEAPDVEAAAPEWFGDFLDAGTQLLVHVGPAGAGELSVTYAGEPETVRLVEPRRAQSRSMVAEVGGDALRVRRVRENRVLDARRVAKGEEGSGGWGGSRVAGSYRCAELDSVFHCTGEGDALYGAFDGHFGRGPAHLMRHVGGAVWALECPRGMDAPAPGDWTLVFRADERGGAAGSVTIGCWLARKLEYVRT